MNGSTPSAFRRALTVIVATLRAQGRDPVQIADLMDQALIEVVVAKCGKFAKTIPPPLTDVDPRIMDAESALSSLRGSREIRVGLSVLGEGLTEADAEAYLDLRYQLHQSAARGSGVGLTPPWLSNLVMSLAGPQPGDQVVDSASDIGTFLGLMALKAKGSGTKASFFGMEAHPTNRARIRRAGFILGIRKGLDLGETRNALGTADILFCHPTFRSVTNADSRPGRRPSNVGWESALDLMGSQLKAKGQAFILLPVSAVTSLSTRRYVARALAFTHLRAVIELPAMGPYRNPVLVWFQEGATEVQEVLFADASKDLNRIGPKAWGGALRGALAGPGQSLPSEFRMAFHRVKPESGEIQLLPSALLDRNQPPNRSSSEDPIEELVHLDERLRLSKEAFDASFAALLTLSRSTNGAR